MTIISTTEIQKNFGKYLQAVQNGEEIIILKNSKPVARLVSNTKSISFLTDSLIGVLKNNYPKDAIEIERIAKYNY